MTSATPYTAGMHERTHIPVLAAEIIDILQPNKGESVLDVTLGLGGHAKLFAEKIGAEGSLTGLDADAQNLKSAKQILSSAKATMHFHHINFRDIAQLSLSPFDIIFADLGVSSPHLDDQSRGFSFRADAPLDMRYDVSSGLTAAELIAKSSEEELQDILGEYGEVRHSRKLSLLLFKQKPTTTAELAQCVEQVVGFRAPALLPQVFQALRIAVNDEMGALSELLATAPMLLKQGGRLGIISYHSLEDRQVKVIFKNVTTPKKDTHTGQDIGVAPFLLLTKRAVVPSEEEEERNPRSRSAKFRAIQKR